MAKPSKDERVKAIVAPMLKTVFIFERPDGTRGAVLKSSPRRKGFTVGLTDLTKQDAEDLGAAVTETLKTLINPKAKDFVEGKCKTWDGERKK